MSIPIISNFDLRSGIPLEAKTVRANVAARDAIPAVQRYPGLKVYTTAEQKNYQLVGGIANSNWVEISIVGTNGANGTSARGVSLTIDVAAFQFDTAGENPSPSTAIITATSSNTVGTVYYEFLWNGVQDQNTTSNTYNVDISGMNFSSLPVLIEVRIRETANNTPVLATATLPLIGLKQGASAITIMLSNDTHSVTVNNLGVINYTGSGTSIQVWDGETQLRVDQISPYGNSTFRVTSATGTNIMPGAASGADGTYSRIFANHSVMTQPNASIEYTIVVKNAAGTETTFGKLQTFSQAIAGDDGVDGSLGVNSRSVNLTMNVGQSMGFVYDTAGNNPSPATATVVATAFNTVGTVYYEFLLEDVSVQNSVANTYVYTPKSTYAGMPDKVEVLIREAADDSVVLARDQITLVGLRAGTHGNTIILSNEAHTLPTTFAGVVTYTGSGTTITAWHGATQLMVDQNTPFGNNTFRVTNAVGSDITPSTPSGADGTASRIYGAHTAMVADSASITYTIVVKDEAGQETTYEKVQTFAKSKQGIVGDTGDTGIPGPGLVYRGIYDPLEVYRNDTVVRDLVSYLGDMYYCSSLTSPIGPEIWTPAHWTAFSNVFDSVATKVLFASLAYIDNLGVRIGEIGAWTIDSDSIFSGTKVTGDGYSAAAGDMTIRSDGSIHARNFYVNSDGTTNIAGSCMPHLMNKTASATPRHTSAVEYSYLTAFWEIAKTVTFTNGLLGQITVVFDLKKTTVGGTDIGSARVYRNGVALGIEHAANGDYGYHTVTENITQDWAPGDILSLRVYGTAGTTTYVQNLVISYDDAPIVAVAAVITP
jgi:hypothetical protein